MRICMTNIIPSLSLISWVYDCVFQMLDQLCVIVAMISAEQSCSFQVFLRSGLAVK